MKHLGDITRLNGAEIEPVDVITGGSLFDGIGGFPLSWPGRTAWSSEIDEFPLAVLRARFGEEHTGCCVGTSKHLRA